MLSLYELFNNMPNFGLRNKRLGGNSSSVRMQNATKRMNYAAGLSSFNPSLKHNIGRLMPNANSPGMRAIAGQPRLGVTRRLNKINNKINGTSFSSFPRA